MVLGLALWTFCEGSRTYEVGCMFHLGACNDSTYIHINLVLIRTYIVCGLPLSPSFAFAFLFFKLDSSAFFAFVLAFSALVLICFVVVPEPAVLSSGFVSETSSVAFFVIPPACLFRFAFCGADHSSKSLTFESPQYFLEFNRAVTKAQTVMSWASRRICLTLT